MQLKSTAFFLAAAAFTASALFAHDYDPNKPVTLTGTVSKIEWQSPYVKIHLQVMDSNGKAPDWEIQTATPNVLQSDGLMQTSINHGDKITVQGIADKNGSDHALAQSMTLANGQMVSMNASEPQASPTPSPKLPGTASNQPWLALMAILTLAAAAMLRIGKKQLS